MKTMYMAEERTYTDCEGRNTKWVARTAYTTYEEAKEVAKTIIKKNGYDTGDWRIVARTIDEATFTVKDEVVEEFDWTKEVWRKEYAKHMVETFTKVVEKAKAIKTKTAVGEARKAKQVAEAEAVLARYMEMAK